MFCTNGVLLRMLTQGDGLADVTHIIVDEVGPLLVSPMLTKTGPAQNISGFVLVPVGQMPWISELALAALLTCPAYIVTAYL